MKRSSVEIEGRETEEGECRRRMNPPVMAIGEEGDEEEEEGAEGGEEGIGRGGEVKDLECGEGESDEKNVVLRNVVGEFRDFNG